MLDFLNEANWWCLLLLLFLAFLLGWFLARWALKNKYSEALDKCLHEKEKLRNASMNYKKANTTFSNSNSSSTPVIPIATSTSSDKEETIKTDTSDSSTDADTPKLNFASFGKADESQKDDLKKISGVGPFIEKKLNSIGIYTFDQISKFTKEDIDTVTALIQFFPGRIERDNWKDQASKLNNQ